MGFRVLTEQERKRLLTKEVEIEVPRQVMVTEQVALNVLNTVTESMSGESKSKANSSSSSICGDPTVASNQNELSGHKRNREHDICD